jgi:3'-phosphoadenosine 5'-phosphosulfate sulfotransferase (PAPS reductase)/FAD synthetase
VRRCARCTMPETYQGISFDDNGVCSLCAASLEQPAAPRRLEELGEVIRSYGRGGEYNCVIPLSGGKDSTYILYSAVRDLGLRVIAVNYDSGYQSEEGRDNVRNACDALGVRLVVARPDERVQRAMLREILEISRVLGIYTRTCTNCELMLRNAAVRTARQYDVPVILWGSASAESAEEEEYTEYRSGRPPMAILSGKLTSFRRLRLSPAKSLRLLPHALKYTVLSTRHRIGMRVPLSCIVNPYRLMPFPRSNPVVVHYFDYASWDPSSKTALLKRELGWRHPPERESRFDCKLYSFVEHRHLTLHGITDSGAIECMMVREGRMSPEDALRRESAAQDRVARECDELVRSLDLAVLR